MGWLQEIEAKEARERNLRGLKWMGWEYENDIGTHMVVSKRHLFKPDGRPVCGVKLNRYFKPSAYEGDEVCNRCFKFAIKNDIDV